MKTLLPYALTTGLLVSFNCLAAAPAGAPVGSTALCKDGTYYSGAEKKGACSGHKGVKDWWGDAATAKSDAKAEKKAEAKSETKPEAKVEKKAEKKAEAATPGTATAAAPAAKAATTASAGTQAAKPAAPATAAGTTGAPAKTETPKPAAVAAAGGGVGKVWANESTKVYHCFGDRWYGKTKQGEYMTEADARAKGFTPDHGKACQ